MFSVDPKVVSLRLGDTSIAVHWLAIEEINHRFRVELEPGDEIPAAALPALSAAMDNVVALQRGFLRLNDQRLHKKLRGVGL